MSPFTRTRVWVVLAALCSLMGCALTGCVSTSSSASGSPSATPSPTTASAPPASRVPTTCAELADTSAFAQEFGTGLAATSASEPTLNDAAQQQYGTLDCRWSAGTEADNIALSIAVVPDVSDAAWAEISTGFAGDGSTTGAYPGDSHSGCGGGVGGRNCGLDTRIGTWWLSVSASSNQPGDAATATSWGKPNLSRAASVVSNLAPAGPRWTPAATPTGPTSCSAWSAATDLATASATTGVDAAFGGPTTQSGSAWQAQTQTGYWFCYFTSSGPYFDVQFLPGGSWAWNQVASSAGSTGAVGTVTGLGDRAISITGESQVAVLVEKSGSLMLATATQPSGGTFSSAEMLRTASGVAAALASAVN